MYNLTTRSIHIAVEPFYLPDQSKPGEDHYLFGYRVKIENRGLSEVTMVGRYWRIIEADGRTTEVRGDGVVGEQPTLAPGQTFEYTSGAPLKTPSGFMRGTYQMVTPEGEAFDVTIPAFSLDATDQPAVVH
ncbi:MAG: Co2+/Mg2+ efflux protein ApaG [Geminicoccaceae bacterium]